MFSRPEQRTRHPKPRSKRSHHSSSSKNSHRYRGRYNPTPASSSYPSGRRGVRASTSSHTPKSSSVRSAEMWMRSGRRLAAPRPVYEHQRSGISGRECESQLFYIDDSRLGRSTSDVWPGPMPHAPLPPTWDDRFYAGAPTESAGEVARDSYHQMFVKPKKRRKRGFCVKERPRSKVFIDIDDPLWRGVRVNLVRANFAPRKTPPHGVPERLIRSVREEGHRPYHWENIHRGR